MASSNQKLIDFSRQLLLDRVTKPQAAIALYPQNTVGTTLTVKVTDTTVTVSFTDTSTTTQAITYNGKSVQAIVDEINRTDIPVLAISLSRALYLGVGDLVSTLEGSTSVAKAIPAAFEVHDRLPNKGVILRTKRYSIRHITNTQIGILPPYEKDPALPWYPRISIGQFSQKYRGRTFHFGVPEYHEQTWSLRYGFPFRDVLDVNLRPLGANAFQVPLFPIFWNFENITLYNGGVPLSTSVIRDVDVHNGILYLNQNISVDEGLTADYSYKEETYEYPYVNINGHFTQNPSLLDKFVILYARPFEGGISTAKKRGIYHIESDSILGGIDQIELESQDIPVAIIGAYNIQQIRASDRATILDTRSRGGGLVDVEGPSSPIHELGNTLEDNYTRVPIEEAYKEARNFYDIGNYDGEPYPGAAAVVVDLPSSVREALPITDIKKRASKFFAAGVYPVFNLSDRDLPGVTGMSMQISCAHNLDFSQSVRTGDAQISGIHWLPTEISIPDNTVLTGWPAGYDIENAQVSPEGTGFYAESQAGSGVFTTYLKSTPHAGIQWEERQVVYNSGNPEAATYGLWETKTFMDTRVVEGGRLLKGYLAVEPEHSPKQVRKFTVQAPFRLDTTGQFKKEIEIELRNYTGYLQNLQYSGNNKVAVEHTQPDLTSSRLSPLSGYYGVHPANKFVFSLIGTSLEEDFTGYMERVGSDLLRSVDVTVSGNSETSGLFSNYTGGEVHEFGPPVSTTATITENLEMLAGYAKFRHHYYGSGDSKYQRAMSGLSGLWVHQLSGDGSQYLPADIRYTAAGAPTGVSYTTGVANWADISVTGNEDHRLTELLPGLALLFESMPTYSGYFADQFTGMFLRIRDDISGAVARADVAITGAPVNAGFTVADHWYTKHDRYGQYAGTLVKDIARVYDSLKAGHQIVDFIPATSGADGRTLELYFRKGETVLEKVYTGFNESLQRGGILDPETARLLYGYGWYVNTQQYHLAKTGVGEDNRQRFKGIFETGLHTLIRNMVTTEGDMYESTIVEGRPGPFDPLVPAEIFDTLAMAYRIKQTDIGLAQAVFNTVTGKYSFGGAYPSDPRSLSPAGGRESEVAANLAKLYSSIDTGSNNDLWEPIREDYSNIRGVNFVPTYPGRDATPPRADWKGVASAHAMWRYYETGAVERQLGYMKGLGINFLRVFQSFYIWDWNSGQYLDTLEHFLTTCDRLRLRVMPVLWDMVNLNASPNILNPEENVTQWTRSPPISVFENGAAQTTTDWYRKSGLPYVQSVVETHARHDCTLVYDVYNESPGFGRFTDWYDRNLRTIKSGDTNPSHKTMIGHAAAIDYTGITNWNNPTFNNDAMEVVSHHPYVFAIGDRFDEFHNIATGIAGRATGKPLLLSEGGGRGALTNNQAYFNACTGAINSFGRTGMGFCPWMGMIGRPGGIPFGNAAGFVYHDGEIREEKAVRHLQDIARSHGVPEHQLIDFKVKTDFNGFLQYPTGASPSEEEIDLNKFMDEVREWERGNKPSMSGIRPRQVGEVYAEQSAKLLACNQDLLAMADLTEGLVLTGTPWERNRFSLERQREYIDLYTGEFVPNNFSASLLNARLTPAGKLDASWYDRLFVRWGSLIRKIVEESDMKGFFYDPYGKE